MLNLTFLQISVCAGMSATALAQSAQMPELNDARVTISYSELKALWQAAQPSGVSDKPKPPASASLTSARYEIRLLADQAQGTAEFDAQSFSDEWTMIPLLGADVQIDKIEPADAQVFVRDGQYVLATNRGGKTNLKLHFATNISNGHIKLTAMPAIVNVLSVTEIPEEKTIRIDGATKLSAEANRMTFRLPARAEIDLEIVKAASTAGPIPSVWKIESQSFAQFAEGKLRYHARITANAENGSGNAATLTFPPSARITKVTGDDISSTSISADAQKRAVQIQWSTADVLSREVEILYEIPQSATAAEWNLQAPGIVEGEVTSALFAIEPLEGIELIAKQPGAAGRRLPRWLAERSGQANIVIAENDGAFAAKPLPLMKTTPATIDRATAKMRVVGDGSVLNVMNYAVNHKTPLAWRLQLPKETELLTCAMAGRQINPINRGENLLEFSLPVPDAKGFTEIEISYTARKPAFKPVSGRLSVELPQTELLVQRLDWDVSIPMTYEVEALEGNVEAVNTDARTDAGARVIRLRKELGKGEMPVAEIFYKKPENPKTK